MSEQGIDGQGTPAITTVEAAHDLGQNSEGLLRNPPPPCFLSVSLAAKPILAVARQKQ